METIIKEKKIEFEIIRDAAAGKTVLKFSVHPEIERVFANESEETRESNNWKDLKFYSTPELHGDENYNRLLRQFQLFDDYGSKIIRANGGYNEFNIAWIRTVGGHGEIVIPNTITEAELAGRVRGVTQFLKVYFQEKFKSFSLKGVVTFNI